MTHAEDPRLLQVLSDAAESVAYTYGKWIGSDDLFQDAWVWALEHPLLTASFLDKEKPDVTGLNRVIQDYLRTVAQKEKAQQVGFHVDDVVWYTPRVIAEVLPMCLNLEDELAPSAGPTDSDGGRVRNIYGTSDFVATLLDVRNAWITTAFRGDEARLIEARFIDGMDWHHMAASFGLELEEVKRRVAVGLRRMTNTLGGVRGRHCPSDCPDCVQRFVKEER